MTDREFKGGVISAIRQLMRPVARLMLSAGIPWREFAEHVKQVFVAVAHAEYGTGARPATVSRISLLTGMSRKEVRRRLDLQPTGQTLDAHVRKTTDATRILSVWHQHETYRHSDGHPRPLPLEGPAPSFQTLHAQCGCDIPMSTILKELDRAGAIRIDGGTVHALTRYYMPAALDVAAVRRTGSVFQDLGNTLTFNLAQRAHGRSRFEARATDERVRLEDVAEFQRIVEDRAMAFLEEIDAWLGSHQATGDEPAVRLGIGVYMIQNAPDGAEGESA